MSIQCEKCGATLPVKGDLRVCDDNGFSLIVSLFPQMLMACFITLMNGPGSVLCLRCNNIAKLDAPHFIYGENGEAVLYLPDRIVKTEQLIENVTNGLNIDNKSNILITNDLREFRRGVLSRFVVPHGTLMNSFTIETNSGMKPIDWIKIHEHELNASFFCGLWLVASGAVQVFGSQQMELPSEALVRHETAPVSASHVVERSNTQAKVAEQTGIILGWLLITWAIRTLENRTLQPFIGACKIDCVNGQNRLKSQITGGTDGHDRRTARHFDERLQEARRSYR